MTIKLTDSNIKKSLKQDGRKQLYFLAGNDDYLLATCKNLIASDVGGEVVTLDFQTASDEEVEEHLSTFSFEPKTLILENFKASAYTEDKRKLYTEFLKELPGTLTVIVMMSSEDPRFSVPKAAEAFCSLADDAAMVLCTRKTGGDLVRYIDAIAKRQGCTLDYGATEEIIRLNGEDLQQIASQMEVLAAASNYGKITADIVRKMCPKTTEENVFDFVRAMERGRTEEAVSIMYEMLEQEQDVNRVLAAISSSFVNIARAKAAVAEKKSREEVEEVFGYKKNDRALQIAFDKVTRYSDKQMSAILDCLYDTDRKLKQYAGDKQTLLEQGLVRLTMIVSGREVV
ncbi:MAG: DNA polymerase III subunit delta [Oscillospiraceae bacterium]|nr:DNA polymerase III subunit delta [Oscillospiraceae bacterium]MBR0450984.1 DNA polymerase III subunit delta [Oscillospiraceae bacterium]